MTLNRGSKDGLEVGNVLAMFRNPLAERQANRPTTLFGRTGPTGSDTEWEAQKVQREDFNLTDPRSSLLRDSTRIDWALYGFHCELPPSIHALVLS